MPDPATNIVYHTPAVSADERRKLLGCAGCTIWLTGLSGSGKSTVASALERALVERGRFAAWLDGDNLRHGLCKDLGFSEDDRRENIRRVAEVSRLMADAGVVVITSFISPYAADRDGARALHQTGPNGRVAFFEVFCDTSLDECEKRDPKGLYKKARAGLIQSFTGLSAPYEAPANPELVVRPGEMSVDQCVAACLKLL